MTWLVVLVVCATAAAVMGTWSPCGLSMLSTFTPIAESGRGRRYGVTVAWFVAGSVVGGAALGSLGAIGAMVFSALDLGASVSFAVAAAAFAAGFLVDRQLVGPELPHHRRQVNETWLRQFRRWVTASGFGLQIGFGLATYIMTTGVYLTILAGALSARPGLALAAGSWFGLVRGAAVLATLRVRDHQTLIAMHGWLDEHREPAGRAMSSVLAGLAVACVLAAAGLGAGFVSAAAIAGCAIGLGVFMGRDRRTHESRANPVVVTPRS